MEKCDIYGCDSDADYIDSADNYSCADCMDSDLENSYTCQKSSDYEKLNWFDYPENGFSY